MIFGAASKIQYRFISSLIANQLRQSNIALKQNINGNNTDLILEQNTNSFAYNAATLTGSEYFYNDILPQLTTQDLSICLSFKSNIGNAGTGMLVTRQNNGNTNYWSVYLSLGRIAVEFSRDSGSGNNIVYVTGNGFANNQWHHLTINIRRNDGNVIIYDNGTLLTGSYTTHGNITGDMTNTIQFQIGSRNATGFENRLGGQISRVGISYGYDLTQYNQYLSKLSNWGDLPPSIQSLFVAYYDLANWQNHNNFELLDRSGISGALTASGTPTYTSSGINIIDNKNDTEVGYSLWMMANNSINVATLNGTNQGFYINTFPILGTADLSICCSFRSAPGTAGILLARQNDDNNEWSSFVSLGQVGIVVSKGSNYIGWRSTDTTLQDNTTKHVVMTLKRNGTATISINGVDSTMYIYTSSGNINGISYDGTTPVTIGYRTYPGFNTYMPGKIWNVGCSFGTDLNIYKDWLGKQTDYNNFPQGLKNALVAYYELSNYTNHNGYELIDRTGNQGNITPLNSPIYTSEIPVNNYLGASSTVNSYGGVTNNGPLIKNKTTWHFDNVDDGIKIQGAAMIAPMNSSEWHIWLVCQNGLSESFGPQLTFSNYTQAYTLSNYGAIAIRDSDITNNGCSITIPNPSGFFAGALNTNYDIGSTWHIIHTYKNGNTIYYSIDGGPEVSTTFGGGIGTSFDTIGLGAMFRINDGISGNSFSLSDIADVRICGAISTNQAKAVYKELRTRYFIEEPIPYSARVLWNVGNLIDISQSNASPLNEYTPPLSGTYQNGYSSLYYDGSRTTRWAISSLASFDQHNFTVFLVANSQITSDGISWSASDGSSSSPRDINLYIDNALFGNKSMAQSQHPPGTTNTYGAISSIVTSGSVHVYRFRITTSALYLSIDGCDELSLSVDIASLPNFTRIAIGAWAAYATNYYDILTVYEHSIVKSADVTLEQLDLESIRLKNKYNL